MGGGALARDRAGVRPAASLGGSRRVRRAVVTLWYKGDRVAGRHDTGRGGKRAGRLIAAWQRGGGPPGPERVEVAPEPAGGCAARRRDLADPDAPSQKGP
jgi:hypothetical protein